MKRIIQAVSTLIIFGCLFGLKAQEIKENKVVGANNMEKTNEQVENSPFKVHGKFGFFFTGGYSFGLDDVTSGKGKYIGSDSDVSTNDFYIKYARINGALHITPKIKANLLLNLADFQKDDVSEKVLEIASITYQFNKMFNLRVGQFRPYFGVEDTYGVGNHLSNTWSNTYSVLGKSQWQSFQIGASLYGSLEEQNIPIKYYFNVYNGDGKNKLNDNDSNKNVSGRLTLTAIPGVEISANYATATHLEENIDAMILDFKTSHDLNSEFQLNTEFSYATGNNLSDAVRLEIPAEDLDDYKFRGWYFTPQIVYELNNPNLKSIAFSCRYEALTSNLEFDDNLRTTLTPMVDFNLDKNFKASIIGIFSSYDEEIEDKGMMDTQWMQLQLQYNY